MMRKVVSGGGEPKLKKSEKMMRKDVSGQRSKFKKSEKMMRKVVSGGGEPKFKIS
jgi:hypothetical protein